MSRKITILALAIVGLHIVEATALGKSPGGALLGNLLQIAASFIATYACFDASRRSAKLGQAFWVLVGIGLSAWGLANIGWAYYEVALGMEPPELSFLRFMFDMQQAFFAMAILLDRDEQAKHADIGFILDAVQITLIFLFIYAGLYYIPSLTLDAHSALLRDYAITTAEVTAVLLLALLRAIFAGSSYAKRLYGGLAAYLFVYAVGSSVANFSQMQKETQSGTLLDLSWTAPLLWAALWAARWQDQPEGREKEAAERTKTLGETILTNAMFGAAPVLVFLLSSGLGKEWREVRWAMLAVSVACYVARMAFADYRQVRNAELVRRQASALDSAVDGMAIISRDGAYAYVNAGYAALLGTATREAMTGRPWAEVSVTPREGRVPPSEEIGRALKKQGRWYGVVEVPAKSGRENHGPYVPVELAVTLLPDGGAVVVSRDLTERREVEQARVDAEIKYQMIVERVAAISYIAEPGINGKWYYVSPQIETILGYTPDEWLATSEDWMEFIHPDDHATVIGAEEIGIKQKSFQAEYRIRRKDGRMIWVSDTAVIIQGSDKHPVMEGLLVDISERKLMEMQSQQARRMEAVGRLAGGIAHDFNNLLTIIKGYTELARRRAETPELKTDIDRIEDASERAAALVRQLLAFSRRQVLQPKNLDLNSVVAGLDQLLRRLLGEHIELRTNLRTSLGTIKADPSQVEQVLMNLVVNARDAMPEGGRLIIETSHAELDQKYASEHVTVKPGPYVMLAVSDTGSGMSAETVAHIFEPFFTTKGGGKGTGLGLATTYGIVKQSGGYIWVYSEPGQGTTFKVYLPRFDEEAEAEARFKLKTAVARGSETILLVEDDDAVRELTEMVLKSYGYSVLVADEPAHAQRLSDTPGLEIALVLTDMVMPTMSGRELVRRLTDKHPHLRVLYMSGYTDNVITSGGVLEPGLAFLQKPFTPASLASKVREVLDAPAPVAKPIP
jgi:two-component system, cell cycle sensor histidine kinase and response regulator CckA